MINVFFLKKILPLARPQNNWFQGKIIIRQEVHNAFFVCFTNSDELIVYVINEKKQYYLQKNPKNIRQCLLKIYIFCFVWSFGGGLKVS